MHLFPLERRRVVMLEGEIFQRSQTVFRVFHVFPLVRACSLVCSIVFHRVPSCSISPYYSYYYYYFLLWNIKEQIGNTVKTYRYQGEHNGTRGTHYFWLNYS